MRSNYYLTEQFRLSHFLLNEEKVYFGQKVGDILSAMQQLSHDAPNMGKRHLIRVVKNIVKQIRRILHGSWSFEEQNYLKVLQKVGVALMKGLDSNDDLNELIASAVAVMDELSSEIDTPVNQIGSPAQKRDDYE